MQVRAFDTFQPAQDVPRATVGSRHYLRLADTSPAKLLTATKPPRLWAALTRVIREEGVLSLWKGNAATILHRLPYSSINFYTYEATKAQLRPVVPQHYEFLQQLAAGGVAGLVACTAVSS